MTNKPRFFNFSLGYILSDDLSILDNARLRLLYYGLALSFFTLVVLMADVVFQHHTILIITTGILLLTTIVLFKYLTYKPRWLRIAHIILIVGTIMNIADVYLSIQNVDIVSVEVIIMLLMFGVYMLGQKIGIIYALINIAPVLNLLIL